MIYFRVFAQKLACLFFMSATVYGAQEYPVTHTSGLIHVESGFFMGRSASDPTLWFGAQRLDNDPEALKWWNNYGHQTSCSAYRYRDKWGKMEKKPSGLPNPTHMIGMGAGVGYMDISRLGEIWAVFASPCFGKPGKELEIKHIEMAFASSTSLKGDVHVFNNMGIERGYNYLLENMNFLLENIGDSKQKRPNPFPFHPRIAVQLHGFSAHVMKVLHPCIDYMFTVPMATMALMVAEALPDNTYFLEYGGRLKAEIRLSKPIETQISAYEEKNKKLVHELKDFPKDDPRRLDIEKIIKENEIKISELEEKDKEERQALFKKCVESQRNPLRQIGEELRLIHPSTEEVLLSISRSPFCQVAGPVTIKNGMPLPDDSETQEEFDWFTKMQWSTSIYMAVDVHALVASLTLDPHAEAL